MKMTPEGLDLIRHFEGFRAKAYRDAVGVWTIGYGHTAMAGPPQVRPGQVISRDEAAEILASDVAVFSSGVTKAVQAELCDAQFSALVSFAYNVGLGAFRQSGVLRAVNAGDFAAVPRCLSLWVKAGKQTLPGLVKRRAAEAAMFASASTNPVKPSRPPFPPTRPTIWSAVVAAALMVLNCIRNFKKEGL